MGPGGFFFSINPDLADILGDTREALRLSESAMDVAFSLLLGEKKKG